MTNTTPKMASSQANWGKKRAASPCCCDTTASALTALEDAIHQVEKTLAAERRVSAILRKERDDALKNARRWETNVDVIRVDVHEWQKKYNRMVERWSDLVCRIQDAHPDFNVWLVRNPEPPRN